MVSPKVKVAAQHDPETLLTSLNSDQRQAVQSALGADDYICILGKAASGEGFGKSYKLDSCSERPSVLKIEPPHCR